MLTLVACNEVKTKSEIGFEDVVRDAIKLATKTLLGIRPDWVQEQKVRVEDSEIVEFPVNMMVINVLED